MNILNHKFLLRVLPILIFLFSAVVSAQLPLTGTHIKNARVSAPSNSVQISESSEIRRIRRFLVEGRVQEAQNLAERYLERLEITDRSFWERYYAHNALCGVYTQSKALDKAESSCTDAINIFHNHWMALNSRGTARLMLKNFDGALRDYQLALDAAGKNKDAIFIINHNLDITRNRMR